MFFIYVDCLNVLPWKGMGVGVMEAENPEFQVASVREREGGRDGQKKKEGRRYKRCSVFPGKRASNVGRGVTV